ncbi:MAG: hypothetical protein ACK5IN_01930 [Microbacterium sp.]|uniref:hypothetical protein n=1 Tax=Microbacterium sp. TaxID=51671 RepID=UPI003A83BC53
MPGKFDLTITTLQHLLDDRDARAIIDEVVPELPHNPMVAFVKGMPVDKLLQMAGDKLPADKVDELRQRIEAL